LQASDLQIIGAYLYGPGRQRQLARAIHYSERQVRYWKTGERPMSSSSK
jgi:hypothetical protein